MGKRIQQALIERYPELRHLFVDVGVIPRLKPRTISLDEAVVRVVVGQMLSSKAANTIHGRVLDATRRRGLRSSWMLREEELRQCGLSAAKARTIREFAAAMHEEPTLPERWSLLDPFSLMSEVKTFWGMSDWTAAIIAIFYLGHEDVFPKGDSSLKKALLLAERKIPRRLRPLSPDRAMPHRSYLALYLWRALDLGILEGAGAATRQV